MSELELSIFRNLIAQDLQETNPLRRQLIEAEKQQLLRSPQIT